MSTPPFRYAKWLQTGPDNTVYEKITADHVSVKQAFGKRYLFVEPEGLRLLAERGFKDISYYYRPAHLKLLSSALNDPSSSDNDRFVAHTLLENAVIAAEGLLPMCQDTGTATIMGWKGERVQTGVDDAEQLSAGVYDAYANNPLRYSQQVSLSMFEESNSGTNLPAQIDISATEGEEYRFLFVAKGGGSANKTSFYAGTPVLLNADRLYQFLAEKIPAIGVAACPPYYVSVVIGGTSPEQNLKVNKLASAGYLDGLPVGGQIEGIAYRDLAWEGKVMEIAANCGLGAQFLGRRFALDARVIRLTRHAASVPISIAVSCSAHRNALAKITADGIFLEALEKNPKQYYSPEASDTGKAGVSIDLNRPLAENLAILSTLKVGTLLSLTGPLVVARDLAHARLMEQFEATQTIPDYFKDYFIYYAGPAKTPQGMASGSFGPTTAQRMDTYLETFMKNGASLVTLAKGNRSSIVADACREYGGFYLGTIGGAAALVAKRNIINNEILDYPELGMEAVRKIEVKDMPAIVICDHRGNRLY